MVSKIAVIALVAVIAVPIMAGYALNLEEETGYRFQDEGQPVNVTPYLQNSVEYSYTNVDVYTLNSQRNFGTNNFGSSYPIYESFSNSRSSVQLNVSTYAASDLPVTISTRGLTVFQAYFEYPRTHNAIYHYPNVNVFVDSGGSDVYNTTFARVISVTLDAAHGWTNFVTYLNDGSVGNTIIASVTKLTFNAVNDWQGTGTIYTQNNNSPSGQFVNFVDGFRLNPAGRAYGVDIVSTQIKNTMDIKDELLTFDLDSISINGSFSILGNRAVLIPDSHFIEFVRSTPDSVVTWTVNICQWSGGSVIVDDTIDLYYNPAGNNTYQLLLDSYGGQLRYVGAWPNIIGPANVYKTYDFTLIPGSFDENPSFLDYVTIYGYTPIMRIDGATARAFVSNIIEDATYSPGVFKDNPSTTITDLKVVGTSLTFGGHTYAATKDGYITLNGHKVPINKLSFNSIPGENGTYDNRIGDDVISNTPEPATLTFNGRWGANVQTISQEETTYTETKWIAGDFAFNGIDSQFLMVGLITCVGAFIALGVYGRRSGTKVLPLMLVCAGAGILFLLMI